MRIYTSDMRPIEHIRRNVLRLSQVEMAELIGVTQPTVSRWENGEFEPSMAAMEIIRATARARKIRWSDRWFFETPSRVAAE